MDEAYKDIKLCKTPATLCGYSKLQAQKECDIVPPLNQHRKYWRKTLSFICEKKKMWRFSFIYLFVIVLGMLLFNRSSLYQRLDQ